MQPMAVSREACPACTQPLAVISVCKPTTTTSMYTELGLVYQSID